MATLTEQLHAVLNQPLARKLAAATPLWLVSAISGVVIGAAVRGILPGSEAVVGLMTGMATNLVSSLAYDLIKPDLDDDQREQQIGTALAARDPQTSQLVAESLLLVGPQLASAMPDATRSELTAALAQGMASTGGVLQAIAPRYTAALQNPATDWQSLLRELRTVVEQTRIDVAVGHDSTVEHLTMLVSGQPGDVALNVTAGDRARVSGLAVTRTGAGTQPPTINHVTHIHGDAEGAVLSGTFQDSVGLGAVPPSRSRRCTDCGTAVPRGGSVCPSCGLTLTEENPPQSA